MKRYFRIPTLFAVTLIMLCISTHAQETKNVASTFKGQGFKISENYSVLKSDPKVRHGLYHAEIADYRENGQYKDGSPAGVWEGYWKGVLTFRYDYSTKKVLEEQPSKIITKITQLDEQGNPVRELPVQSLYMGGDRKMLAIMLGAVRYPKEAQSYNVQGTVTLSAILTPRGLQNIRAETKHGHQLEEETIRMLKLLPADGWLPVFVDGQLVPVRFQFNFTYTMSDS